VIEYLREENRVLKAQVAGRRLRLTHAQRRRLASRGHALGRSILAQVATLVTPDTILRWQRQLIARKWTAAQRAVGRPSVLREICQLRVRMARENPTWGYWRIQGALKNLGHRVARSTIATILRNEGIGPVPERPTSWRSFLAAHWEAIAAADFFTTEVWTAARARHLLHAVRHRTRLAARASGGVDTTSRRRVHGPDRAHAHPP
jgi:putative transposase